eukprot:8155828-Lingulodinium_polyedra.AAC.1
MAHVTLQASIRLLELALGSGQPSCRWHSCSESLLRFSDVLCHRRTGWVPNFQRRLGRLEPGKPSLELLLSGDHRRWLPSGEARS